MRPNTLIFVRNLVWEISTIRIWTVGSKYPIVKEANSMGFTYKIMFISKTIQKVKEFS